MKKAAVAVVLFLSFWVTGCLKKDSGCQYSQSHTVAPAAEQQALADYLTANNITNATAHSSGMYYHISDPGSGGFPNLCSTIVIGYTGKLTNGSVFDAQPNALFVLGSLIEGWKMGLPLIQKGGKIRLYIPPSLGYGSNNVRDQQGNVVIPANSILIFDISLNDIQ